MVEAAIEPGTVEAHAEVAGEASHYVEAVAFGFMTPGFVIALAMTVVLAIMWRAKVHKIIAAALDSKIAGIREQLDMAAKLREEAEALKLSYERKAKEADAEIEALKQSAERQAADIVAKAKEDATQLIARHKAVSAAKIAAAERNAVEELRARAADAAVVASRNLIAGQHDAASDKALADEVIANI